MINHSHPYIDYIFHFIDAGILIFFLVLVVLDMIVYHIRALRADRHPTIDTDTLRQVE